MAPRSPKILIRFYKYFWRRVGTMRHGTHCRRHGPCSRVSKMTPVMDTRVHDPCAPSLRPAVYWKGWICSADEKVISWFQRGNCQLAEEVRAVYIETR